MTAFHEQSVESIAVCCIVLSGVQACYISAPKFSENSARFILPDLT